MASDPRRKSNLGHLGMTIAIPFNGLMGQDIVCRSEDEVTSKAASAVLSWAVTL